MFPGGSCPRGNLEKCRELDFKLHFRIHGIIASRPRLTESCCYKRHFDHQSTSPLKLNCAVPQKEKEESKSRASNTLEEAARGAFPK